MKLNPTRILFLAASLFAATFSSAQPTKETWESISTASVNFVLPAKELKRVVEGVQNLRGKEVYAKLFAGKIIEDYHEYAGDGNRIKCRVLLMKGSVDNVNIKANIDEYVKFVKEAFLSEPVFSLASEKIQTTDGVAEVYLQFKGTKERLTIVTKIADGLVVLLSVEDVSDAGEETDYFIKNFKIE